MQAEEEAAALRKRMAGYGGGGGSDAERPPKRPKPERAPLTIPQALEQMPPDRNAVMVRSGVPCMLGGCCACCAAAVHAVLCCAA